MLHRFQGVYGTGSILPGAAPARHDRGQRAGTAVAVMPEADIRKRLVRTAASTKSEARAVLRRARIVLAAADGLTNGAIARELEVSVNTLRKWRGRFAGTPLKTA
jgi:DNA-directed RNA polymerase specialized sigma24 family protein